VETLTHFWTTGPGRIHRSPGELVRSGSFAGSASFMYTRTLVWIPTVLRFLAACGGDDDGGNEDTLFTGFSGVIILALVDWFLMRKARNRS